jgi:CheY-like chemotaxis protein
VRRTINKSKRAVCFVDDDPEEVRRFRENLGRQFVVGAGTTLEEALRDLRRGGRRTPDLFALDLYFPEGGANTEAQQEELHAAWQEVQAAQAKFRAVLERLGQSARGGRRLAKRIRRRYPSSKYIFFTRKATLEEGLEALREGALCVIKKPDPTASEARGRSIGEAEDSAFRRCARQIARELNEAIRGTRCGPRDTSKT